MNEPLISVVMPAYNAEKHISESIDSVIAQTYTNWELIIVDDGSTDGTAKIIKNYQLTETRIKYAYQKNSKQGKAKNKAIELSNGQYIAFLDSDDLWLREKLALTLKELIEGNYSLVFTDSFVFETNPQNTSSLKTLGVGNAIFEGRDSIIMFLDYNRIPNLTVLVKKDVLEQTGDFIDKVVAEDYEMWLRLLKNGCVFKSISTPLSLYRLHNESITSKDRHATFEIIEIIKNFGEKHPEFRKDVNIILKRKIKHWLYHGTCRNSYNFRKLIKGIYELPTWILLYIFSILMPINLLRKFVIRVS